MYPALGFPAFASRRVPTRDGFGPFFVTALELTHRPRFSR